MFYFIHFKLTKGEGAWPSLLSSESMDAVQKALHFELNNDNELLPISGYQLVADGTDAMTVESGVLTGHPEPVLWLRLEEEVDVEDEEAWMDILGSEQRLDLPGREPFSFQDHNGYSRVYNAEWLADAMWSELLPTLAASMQSGETRPIDPDRAVQKIVDRESLQVTMRFTDGDSHFRWTFGFNTTDALNAFQPMDQTYTNDAGTEFPEEDPHLWWMFKACGGDA
jgi:hypothetical protein